MADLYSVIPGLQVTQQEIIAAELLAQQILQAQYPDLDLRSGTGLADLTIRPNALLLATVKTGLDYYFTQNTLSGVDDTTPTDVVDSILSNWFISRNTGETAIINVRLYFARRKNITITTDVYFSPDNTLLYYPASTISYTSDELSYDSSQNEYYVDIDLTAAATGTSYNLGEGSLLYFGTFDAYFLHAEINYLSQTSTDAETNSEFISRASSSISTRNLINQPSIKANLLDNFNYLSQILTVGMGDLGMIRDQIYAYLTAQVSLTPTALTYSGSIATATLAAHGYQVGQQISVKSGKPSLLNGGFPISAVTTNTFSYEMDSTPSTLVSILPTITPVYEPILLHNGGMTDVYCSNSLATSVVQLTTDLNGDAILTGPVFKFSRSLVTGGTSSDTIPTSSVLTYSTYTVSNSAKTISVNQPSHGLLTGQALTVSGFIQTQTITSISCSGFTVTIVCAGHGLATGDNIVISGVSPTTYNGTYTVVVKDVNTLIFTVAASVTTVGSATDLSTGMVFTNPNLDGSNLVTVVDANNYTISTPGLWTVGNVTGTLVLNKPVTFTYANTYAQTFNGVIISVSGTAVTITAKNHSLSIGQYVGLAGVTPTGYNGTWPVANVIDQDNFLITLPSAVSGTVGYSSAVLTSVIPWYDVGFSTRQELVISFGSAYAAQTASFLTYRFDYLPSIQTYLDSSENRVTSGDILARGFNFYLLDIDLTSYSSTLPDTATITTTVNTYLTSLTPGDKFLMSDLISLLYEAGVTDIQTPIGVSYTRYTRSLTTPNTGLIIDYLDPADDTNIFILGTVTTSNISV